MKDIIKRRRLRRHQSLSANRRRRKDKTLNLRTLVDNVLARSIVVRQNGVPRRMTKYEAITYQLWLKAVTGNKRANKVLLKYIALGVSQRGIHPRIEIRYGDKV